MANVSVFVTLIVLHLVLYSVVEKFGVLTVIFAFVWSGISFAFFAAIKTRSEKINLLVSSLLLSLTYFLVYVVLVYPSFSELRLFGWQVIKSGALTWTGYIYLIGYAVAESFLLIAAVYAVRLARQLLPP